MANKRLNAVITIGGAISGSLRSAFGTATGELQKIGRAVGELKNRQKELNNVVAQQERLGTAGSALKVQLANQELGAINKQIDAYRRKQEMLRRELDLHNRIGAARAKYRGEMFDRVGSAVAVGAIMRSPLRAFEELDDAMNNLEVALTNSTGKVPAQFEQIKKQTIELGNLLPGTTADFVNVARALKEQGMGIDSIVGGALKSSAHLAVVMKMVPEQAGEMVAKLREAFQLSDDEFGKMADYTQRAKFGFGLKPDDLLLGAKYYGGKLNSLGITGAENVRKIYALQGMAAQQGMDGSTFGTNFSMMLTRVGLLTERLHKNSKEMKAVNAELAKAGVKLEFFDKKGKFAGVDNMVAQLDKLKNFSQEKRLQILTRLFGEEGGRPADLISRNGIEGFRKALEAMDNEASLDRRIEIATKSFKNTIEALTGTVTNALAAIGAPLAEMFMPVITRLNEIVGGPMQEWIEKNKTIVQVIGGLVTGAAGLLAVGGAISGIAYVSTFAAGGLVTLWGVMSRISGLISIATPAVLALRTAFITLGTSMMATPIGWIVAGIAAIGTIGFVVWKKWETISAFFTGFWQGFSDGMSPVLDKLGAFGVILEPVGAMFNLLGSAISTVWGWFTKLFEPIKASADELERAGSVGQRVGQALADAFNVALKPLTMLADTIKWIADNIGGVIDKIGGIWSGTKSVMPGVGLAQPAAPVEAKSVTAPAIKQVGSVVGTASAPVNPPIGSAVQPPAKNLPAAALAPTPPSVPAIATSRSQNVTNTVNQTNTINVTQQPGQDGVALADQIDKMLRDKWGAARRGAMFDPAYSGAY